jgi:hypothetical protein
MAIIWLPAVQVGLSNVEQSSEHLAVARQFAGSKWTTVSSRLRIAACAPTDWSLGEWLAWLLLPGANRGGALRDELDGNGDNGPGRAIPKARPLPGGRQRPTDGAQKGRVLKFLAGAWVL